MCKSTIECLFLGLWHTFCYHIIIIIVIITHQVVGIHVIGRGADEMMQGFGVAMRVRLFECMVCMYVWCVWYLLCFILRTIVTTTLL